MPSSKIKFRGPFNQFLYIRNISYYRMTFCTHCNFGFPVFCFLKTSDFKTYQHFELNYWSIQSLAFVIDWLIDCCCFSSRSKMYNSHHCCRRSTKKATKTSKSFKKFYRSRHYHYSVTLCQFNGCNIICGVTRTQFNSIIKHIKKTNKKNKISCCL